ncbi:MAG: alpha/beta hydrolase-fold protein [Verrucomicrobiota bacterium]
MITTSSFGRLLKLLAIIEVSTCCVGLVAAHAGEVASKSAAPAAGPEEITVASDGCAIKKFFVPSKSMGREIQTVVVLPPEYAVKTGARYPVLYGLHGSGGSHAAWSSMPPLRRSLREHPMLVVSFDGDAEGWYIDATQKPESQFATFFFDELVPYIDTHYRTRADGKSRGVTGFSMGGLWGVSIYAHASGAVCLRELLERCL